ncbi:MAG: hypothetical protein K0R26_305 [Bacteroidota bacterium]|jgi:hypothetical protein|nr:hypothetical protein [Bacteroidota bacterium]
MKIALKLNRFKRAPLSMVAILIFSFSFLLVTSYFNGISGSIQISCIDCNSQHESTHMDEDVSQESLIVIISDEWILLSSPVFLIINTRKLHNFELPKRFYETPLLPPEVQLG